jgi:curved DNA-binding protein CbpA
MPSPDNYAILQVHPEAETIVIEAAYRRLAREYHPDISNAANAHERMVLLNEAFEVLSNPDSRREYDREFKWHGNRSQSPKSGDNSTSDNIQPLS